MLHYLKIQFNLTFTITSQFRAVKEIREPQGEEVPIPQISGVPLVRNVPNFENLPEMSEDFNENFLKI